MKIINTFIKFSSGKLSQNKYTRKIYSKITNTIHKNIDVPGEMKIERFLGSWKVIIVICAIENILFWFLINYMINMIAAFPKLMTDLDHPGKYLGILNIFPIHLKLTGLYAVVDIIYGICAGCFDVRQAYRMRMAFSTSGFNLNQKGCERWTTEKELDEQYVKIPDKEVAFDGFGGTIVSRIGNDLYIDTLWSNTFINGITRSGKGEMYVIPSIDVYSRAKNKISLVVIDPKMENYKCSKKTLQERGYDTYLLNLDDPLHSMGFNPLQEIVNLYIEKDFSNAELLAQSYAYSIFNPDKPTNTDSFWQDTPTSLLVALILAHLEDCSKEDELENQKRSQLFQRKRNAYDTLEDNDKENEKKRISKILQENPQMDIISNKNVNYLSENIKFKKTSQNMKKVNMYSILYLFTELARIVPDDDHPDVSMLDKYFNMRPGLNRAKLKYAGVEIAGNQTKGSIFSSMLAKLTIFTYENIAKMTAESTLNLKDIGFGEKPIAVFLGIPDYDKSKNFLATVFIRQMYFVLAKMATRNSTGRCNRKVKVIADEVGNIPPIENLETITTVDLGRDISFDLYAQEDEQMHKLYGDDYKTIRSNCANHIYIMANDYDTADRFSKDLGNKTIIDMQRSGERLSTKKHFMENTQEKPLLNANELMGLLPGECVVRRVGKRTDRFGNLVKPTPIFNSKESGKRFLYRYEYLTKTFPNPDSIDLYQINKEDRSAIVLKDIVFDYKKSFAFSSNIIDKAVTLKDLKNMQQIKDNIEKNIGENLDYSMTIADVMEKISNSKLSQKDKNVLYSILNI
jgi:type IV secretion system protein VirD4